MKGLNSADAKLANRVRNVVNESGYFPNTQARALVSGRSRTLGIIISDITNPFFPELIKGFEDAAVEQGYEILVGSTYYDRNRMSRCVRRMRERRVDGVAVMTFGIDETLLEQFAQRKIPLVFIDRGLDSPQVSLLNVDYSNGIRQ
jgi:LacI family transcriptional regulator